VKSWGGEGPTSGAVPAAHRAADICGLMTSPAVGLSECVIELEARRGKMHIQWKGTTATGLGGLSRALWESKWFRSRRRGHFETISSHTGYWASFLNLAIHMTEGDPLVAEAAKP
jgi:hypothetical protein